MRAVVLHQGFLARGGAETLALAQARDLARSGVDVHVVTFAVDPAAWEGALEDLPVHRVARHHWRDLPYLFNHRAALDNRFRRVEAVLRELAPDVVVAHNHPTPAILGACGLRTRKLWYCHEPPRGLYPRQTNRFLAAAFRGGLLAPGGSLARELKRTTAREERNCGRWRAKLDLDQAGIPGLDAIAANSAYTRESVAAAYGGLQANVHYPMVPLQPLPRPAGLDRRGLQVLVQTRLKPMKNVDAVIRGFSAARRHLGAAPVLHVVGTGSDQPTLQALTEDLELGNAVRFHGFLADGDLAALRTQCDVFAFLPWDEPFGMVYLEAAAAGLLLVGSNHGGPQEILGSGRHGECVPPHAPAALAEVLRELWALTDLEVDARRRTTLEACRSRFAPEVALPRFRKWVTG